MKTAAADARKALATLSSPFAAAKSTSSTPFPLQASTRALIASVLKARLSDAESTSAAVDVLAANMTIAACGSVFWLSRRQVALVQAEMCTAALTAAQVFARDQSLLERLLALAVQADKQPASRFAPFLISLLQHLPGVFPVVNATAVLLSRMADDRELLASVGPLSLALINAMNHVLLAYKAIVDDNKERRAGGGGGAASSGSDEAHTVLEDAYAPLNRLLLALRANPAHHRTLVDAGALPLLVSVVRGLFFVSDAANSLEAALCITAVNTMRTLAASSNATEAELLNLGAARAVVLRLRYLGADVAVHNEVWRECLSLLQDLTFTTPSSAWAGMLRQGIGNVLVRALSREGRCVHLDMHVKKLAVAIIVRLCKDEAIADLLQDGSRFWHALETFAASDGYDDAHRDLSMPLVQIAWFHSLRCGAHGALSREIALYVAAAVFKHKCAAARALLQADARLKARVVVTALSLEADVAYDVFGALAGFADAHSIELLEDAGLLGLEPLALLSARMTRYNASAALKLLTAVWLHVDSRHGPHPQQAGLVTALAKALFEFDTSQSRAVGFVTSARRTEAVALALMKGLDFPHASCPRVNDVLVAMRAFGKDDTGMRLLVSVGLPGRLKSLFSHECHVETSVLALLLMLWRDGDFPVPDSKVLEFLQRHVFKLRNHEVTALLDRHELAPFSIAFYMLALQRDHGTEANLRVFRHFQRLVALPGGCEQLIAQGLLDMLTVHEANRAQALDLVETLVDVALKQGPLAVNSNRGLVSFLTRESLECKSARATALLLKVVPRYGNLKGEVQALSKDELVERTTCAICRERLVDPRMAHPCMHEFCGECLQGWLKSSTRKDCPLCRAPVADHFTAVAATYALDRLAAEFASAEP